MALLQQILVAGPDSALYQELVQKRGLTGEVEGGVRLPGTDGVAELFMGFERRFDAHGAAAPHMASTPPKTISAICAMGIQSQPEWMKVAFVVRDSFSLEAVISS